MTVEHFAEQDKVLLATANLIVCHHLQMHVMVDTFLILNFCMVLLVVLIC